MIQSQSQLDTVNRSGYPLQIAIANRIAARDSRTDWRVLYEEHSWKRGESEGFIDLVLEHERLQLVLVIECKRLQNKEWILLPPDGHVQQRRHSRGFRVEGQNGAITSGYPQWTDEPCDPRTPEAVFCVMPKDAREPTVERVASELVIATEALEHEERGYLPHTRRTFKRVYFPCIVTTATLTVCSFDPKDISLADGMIPSNADFTGVGAIRLTKQLSTQAGEQLDFSGGGREADVVARSKERTAFVVNASHLDDFLDEFHLDNG